MLWAIGGIVVGLLVGGALAVLATIKYIEYKATSAMGQAFGWPSPRPWWKFWR